MRCHICDQILKPEEIKQHPSTGKFESCAKCLYISRQSFEEFVVKGSLSEEEGILSREALDELSSTKATTTE